MKRHFPDLVQHPSPCTLAVLAALTCLCASLSASADVLATVDFEVAAAGYTTQNTGDDGLYDYFIRTNDVTRPNTGIAPSFNYSNASGFFMAANDNDEYGEGNVVTETANIISYDNLELSIDIAGDASHGNYEEEILFIEYSVDGGAWTVLMRYAGNFGGVSGDLYEDTNFDGMGDGAQITPTFTTFTYAIPATGSTLRIRVRVGLGPAEDFAFDNITIRGDPPTPATVVLQDGSSFLPVVAPGSTDQGIGRFGLTADVAGAALTAATIRLDGVRTGMSNIKLWSSSDNVLGPGDHQLGSTVSSDTGDGGTVSFSGFSEALGTSTRYFFISADVAFGATGEVQAVFGHTSALTISDGSISNGASEVPLSAAAASLPVQLTGFTVE